MEPPSRVRVARYLPMLPKCGTRKICDPRAGSAGLAATVRSVWPLLCPLCRKECGLWPDTHFSKRAGYHCGRLPPPIIVKLNRGASIEGRVVAAVGGSGVAHVRVVARGLGAHVECARKGAVPPLRAEYQECRTDSEGNFVLRGLEPEGAFQLDPTAPGVVAMPPGSTLNVLLRATQRSPRPPDARSRYPRDRTVIARAGDQDVMIEVIPVGVASVRVVDRAARMANSPCECLIRTLSEFRAMAQDPDGGCRDRRCQRPLR